MVPKSSLKRFKDISIGRGSSPAGMEHTPLGGTVLMAAEVGINTLRLRQNGRRFSDDILKCIFLNEYFWFFNSVSLKYVSKSLIDN